MAHTMLIGELERYGIGRIILNLGKKLSKWQATSCEVGHRLWHPLRVGVGSQTVYFLH